MSVIRKTIEEICEIRNGVYTLLRGSNGKDLKRVVETSNVYIKDFYWQVKIGNNPKANGTEDQLIIETLDRLFWYAHIANSMAYALQYEEQPIIDFGQYTDSKLSTNSPYKTREDFASLAYNICTNAGNIFLGGDWMDLFKSIGDYLDQYKRKLI